MATRAIGTTSNGVADNPRDRARTSARECRPRHSGHSGRIRDSEEWICFVWSRPASSGPQGGHANTPVVGTEPQSVPLKKEYDGGGSAWPLYAASNRRTDKTSASRRVNPEKLAISRPTSSRMFPDGARPECFGCQGGLALSGRRVGSPCRVIRRAASHASISEAR